MSDDKSSTVSERDRPVLDLDKCSPFFDEAAQRAAHAYDFFFPDRKGGPSLRAFGDRPDGHGVLGRRFVEFKRRRPVVNEENDQMANEKEGHVCVGLMGERFYRF